MKFRSIYGTGLLAGALLVLAAIPAQAASFGFSSFNFTTNKTGNNPQGNIWLNSVTVGGNTISNFSLVSGVENLQNEKWTGGNSGAASSDRGDHADGIKVEDPTTANIATSLGNLNLNNIVDTEDKGAFSMELRFASAAQQFFFWERGMNSRLMVEALDSQGTVLAQTILDSRRSQYAGFDINTLEIGENQRVGAMGLQLNSGSTNRLRLTSFDGGPLGNFNGPDFKVVGSAAEPASVPEPATVVGLSVVVGAIATNRRRKSAKQA